MPEMMVWSKIVVDTVGCPHSVHPTPSPTHLFALVINVHFEGGVFPLEAVEAFGESVRIILVLGVDG